MLAKLKRWQRVVVWLVVFKIGYLSVLCGALWLWPGFEQSTSGVVKSWWFPTVNPEVLPNDETGLARHFATWDGAHYLVLSQVGYFKGLRSCAFYPLWPLSMRWFSVFTGGNHLIAGLVLANVFSVAGWTLFYHITAKRFGESVARWALVLLIAFPGSLFYQFNYTEPLFFVLLMLLWFGLEQKRYSVAWIAAFLLPLTRAVGVFSVLPIAWVWIMRSEWNWLKRWTWLEAERTLWNSHSTVHRAGDQWRGFALLLAPPLGLALYFTLMWSWTGNPFEGMEAQKYWKVHSLSNLWSVPKFILGFIEPTSWHEFNGSVLDRCAFLVLVCCLPLMWRLGKDLVVWAYVLAILPAMSGTFVSFTRFESAAFPVFIALAVFLTERKRHWPLYGLAAGMALLHLILVWRFVNYRWAG